MRLLFDQNISFRIVKLIQPHFPDSIQVNDLKSGNLTDKEIWDFAHNNGYTIVTFDSDFNDLSVLYGHPPKIIWMRIGNTSTKNLADFIIRRRDIIEEFLKNPGYKEISCLEFDS